MVNLYRTCTVIILLSFQSVSTEYVTTSIIAEVLRQKDNNVIFSPFLVTEGLWQLYLGSEGKEAKEISKVLQLNGKSKNESIQNYSNWRRKLSPPKDSTTFNWANSLFVANDINLLPQYRKQAMDIFHILPQTVDFQDPATKDLINAWVAKNTNNKINKIIDHFHNKTKFMLLGAIYFKRSWQYQFNKRGTKKDKFHIPLKTGGTRTIQVDMMSVNHNFKLNPVKKLDAMSLELPYANSSISMVILLPNSVNGIDKMIANLNQLEIGDIAPNSDKSNIIVYFPKFKFDVNIELNNALSRLGLVNIFNNATFPAMTDYKSEFHINKIIQKAVIEVDEEGSVASAAQGLYMIQTW